MQRLMIVVPCYNEEEILPYSMEKLTGLVSELIVKKKIASNSGVLFVNDVREYCQKEQNTLWDESRRLVNPQKVYVDLSQKLYDLKKNLLEEMSEKALD